MEPSIFLALFAVIVGGATVVWWWATDPSRQAARPAQSAMHPRRATKKQLPVMSAVSNAEMPAEEEPAGADDPPPSPDPLAVLSQPTPLPVANVESHDADLRAAEQEAHQRWGEFVAAFARRKPDQNFSVKAPLPASDGSKEFIWIEVKQLHSDRIIGRLTNTPEKVPGKQFGDAVQIAVDQVQDWMYTRGRDVVGDFTAKALAARRIGDEDTEID